MRTTNISKHPGRRVLWALVSVAALAAVGCSGKVSFSPTAPEWPIPNPAGLRSLHISGSLTAADGSCLAATVLYDGQEIAGARTQCAEPAPCARFELEALTTSESGHHTVSFQVLQQSQPAIDYMVQGSVLVTRDNISLPGVRMPLRPTRATLRTGEVVTYEIDFSD